MAQKQKTFAVAGDSDFFNLYISAWTEQSGVHHSHITAHNRPSGFSLVELSIVLVILGLLTGGILGGQTLIRAAEMRSITTDLSNYTTAANTFRTRYFALPGDFKQATRFWGGPLSNCDSNFLPDDGTSKETCNGNGNGVIAISDLPNEQLFFWRHLSNAGLVSLPMQGTVTNASDMFPHSKAGSGLQWGPYYMHEYTSQGYARNTTIYNTLMLSKAESPVNWEESVDAEHRGLNVVETWQIDKKIDDGMPGQGNVRVVFCDNLTADIANAEYDLSDEARYCYRLNFLNSISG